MTIQQALDEHHFTILVSADLGEPGGYALDQGARLSAGIPNAELHVLHVVGGPGNDARLRLAAVELRARVEERCGAIDALTGCAVGIHVRAGDPAEEIVDLAAELHADLIVVGTDKSALRKRPFVGSVAAAVMRSASCPVLTAAPTPSIQPPCPDCVQTRELTGGQQWWCGRHAQHHPPAHVLSYEREVPLSGQDPLSGGF